MDHQPLDLLLIAALSESHNESELTQPARDDNNNNNNNNNSSKTDNPNKSIHCEGIGDFPSTTSEKNPLPACDPGLMSQLGCDKARIKSRSTRKTKKTSTSVTPDPICVSTFATIESPSLTRLSSAYALAVTERTTTADSPSYVTKPAITATITTADSTKSYTRSSTRGAAKKHTFNLEASRNRKTIDSKKDYFAVDLNKTRLRQSSKSKRSTEHLDNKLQTGSKSLSVRNPLEDSRSQRIYPKTKEIEVKNTNCCAAASHSPEQSPAKTVVIARPQESSVVQVPGQVSNFDSPVPSSSVELAVAPLTPQDGNYGGDNCSKTCEINSVCSGSGYPASSPPASEDASTTTTTPTRTTTTTPVTTTTSQTTTFTAANITTATITKDNKVGFSGNREVERDPNGESFGETQQKLFVLGDSDQCDKGGSLRGGPLAAEVVVVAGQPRNQSSETICELNKKETQQQQQQQLLSLNKRKEEWAGEEESEVKEKGVLESVKTTLPPLSSSSLLPEPVAVAGEGEFNQPAPAASVTTISPPSSTITTIAAAATTTSTSDVESFPGRTDSSDNSISLKNELIASHPDLGLDQTVPYCNSPSFSSCTPSTNITASLPLTAPQPSSTQLSSFSSSSPLLSPSSSSLVDSNEQKLSVITSVKDGLVCITEATPSKDAVRSLDNTTTANVAANSFNVITAKEGKIESVTDSMCGPCEDKIMPSTSGEPSGSAADEKNLESTENTDIQNPDTRTATTTTANPPISPTAQTGRLTLSTLSHKFKVTTISVATSTTSATATKPGDIKNTSPPHIQKLTDPNVDQTLKREELVAAASLSNESPSIINTSLSLHESSSPSSISPSSISFSSSSLSLTTTTTASSTLLPSSTTPTPSPLASIPAVQLKENSISTIRNNFPKRPCMLVKDTKTLSKKVAGINPVSLEGGLSACAHRNPQLSEGSEDSVSSQSSPKLGVDSPESFVAFPQTGFESNESEETPEDGDSNSGAPASADSSYSIGKNLDSAFGQNISNVLERQHESLVSENTCDMEYDCVKQSQKVYCNDDAKSTLSRDFSFGSKVYQNIYGPFESDYDCTFSMQNKKHLLETSDNKIGSTSSGFDTDLLRCTTAIADDHSYCWSVSKTQESESLMRDAHPCDDEISDSSSQDGTPDPSESLSSSKNHNQKATTLTLGASEKNRKGMMTTSTVSKNGNRFSSNLTATKFLVDLPSSRHDSNSKTYIFDQKSNDDCKVNGLLTPVKFDTNSVSITSPKITPLKSSGGRGSLQASPKVGCFRIGTFGSISNIEWDENSDTSSSTSIGSLTLSDKPREKFTYCQKVDLTDKNLTPVSEHYAKNDSGGSGTGRHHPEDVSARLVHILHDHDYCMRTIISPMRSELAKELLSGTKLGSCSSKFSNINNPPKSSSFSSNSLTNSSASSSSSSSPLSASYSSLTPHMAPLSNTDAKSLRKNRNNSVSKIADGSDPLQESDLAEKNDDSSKVLDPNSDLAQTNESKLKITGSFQNDYVYFLNKTTRSRRRFNHEILPDKNLQARNYSDIVIPHLTDADIEALKQKRKNRNNNQNSDLPIWKSSQDTPGMLEADNRLINTVLGMETLCPDTAAENVLPGLIDNAVVPDNLAANPEQYLTPEEMDILFKAVKEVESTNFKGLDEIPKSIDSSYDEEIRKDLSPASMLHEGQIKPSLADVSDNKDQADKSDVSTIATSQTPVIPVSQWSGCNSPTDDLTKSETLTTDNTLLDLESLPISEINPIIGANTDKFKSTPLSCPSGSGLLSSDLNTLCANNSNSSLGDENMPSLEKFVLLNLKSDLFPEPAVTETPSVSEGNAPWIVTVTMFWNDLPAIMIDNQPYIRLVDIHKQILPAKDTGILKKRCQLLGLKVLNCTEFQRYFLVQYGRAYNSKSTLVILKDDAKILIGYYVNPPTRIPKGEGCDDEPVSPGKRITKTNGSLEGRIKKHGRLIGSRKQSIQKIHKNRISCEKLETEGLEPQQLAHQQSEDGQQQQQQQQQLSSSSQLSSRPGQLKVKRVAKERLVFSSSVNGKSRLRHKKINFLNLIRGDTGASCSSSLPSSPAPAATATITSAASSPSSSNLTMLDFVESQEGNEPDSSSTAPVKQTNKSLVDVKFKAGFKNRISALHKVIRGGEQGLKMPVRATMSDRGDAKMKQCNGRVGLPAAANDNTEEWAGNHPRKKRRGNNNSKQFSTFSAISSKLPLVSKWKSSCNSHSLGTHGNKPNHLKVKLKPRSVMAPGFAITSNGETSNKSQGLCLSLSVYHEDSVPQGDKKPCMQPGKLFLSLYSAKKSKCLKCTTCAKVFSVDEFLQHQHLNPNTNSKLIVVSTAQSLRLRDDSNEGHRLLWEKFMVKYELFELEGLEGSRLSPLLRAAGVGMKGPVDSLTTSPTAPIAEDSPATGHNGGSQKSSSTYRVSSRKRKQKQFYPIENYDFKNMPASVSHGKGDSSNLAQFGQCKARGAYSHSVGCSPSKKALMLPVSRTFSSYGLNASTRSERGSHDGSNCGSLSENVVTLKNEPEILSFTALENDEYI